MIKHRKLVNLVNEKIIVCFVLCVFYWGLFETRERFTGTDCRCGFKNKVYLEVKKVKEKVLPRRGQEGPEGEQMYSSTLPSTSTLDGG